MIENVLPSQGGAEVPVGRRVRDPHHAHGVDADHAGQAGQRAGLTGRDPGREAVDEGEQPPHREGTDAGAGTANAHAADDDVDPVAPGCPAQPGGEVVAEAVVVPVGCRRVPRPRGRHDAAPVLGGRGHGRPGGQDRRGDDSHERDSTIRTQRTHPPDHPERFGR